MENDEKCKRRKEKRTKHKEERKKNMKTTKRILAVLLAVMMIAAMMVAPAFAASDGKITITNSAPGVTYKIYKVLNLTYSGTNYSYQMIDPSNTTVETFLTARNLNVDAYGYVTEGTGFNAATFAKDALASGLFAQVGSEKSVAGGGTSVVFDGLEYGYYIVESSRGTAVGVTTATAAGATINEKNDLPSVEKKVYEGAGWADANDAGISDTVKFQITVIPESGAKNYVITDVFPAGGEVFNGYTDLKITLAGVDVDPSNYTLTNQTTGTAPDEIITGFTVSFTQDFCDTLNDTKTLVISYNAVLNAHAEANTAYTNTVTLSYGEAGHAETKNDTTVTKTWEIPIYKYYLVGSTKTNLEGASFVLKNADGYYAQVGTGNKITDWVAEAGAVAVASAADGTLNFIGLDSGIYYLVEKTAPDGFNKLSGEITITVENDGTVKVGGTAVTQVEVENKTGTELPATGGMGTTIFYVIGIVLVLGAVTVLAVKRRKNAQ